MQRARRKGKVGGRRRDSAQRDAMPCPGKNCGCRVPLGCGSCHAGQTYMDVGYGRWPLDGGRWMVAAAGNESRGSHSRRSERVTRQCLCSGRQGPRDRYLEQSGQRMASWRVMRACRRRAGGQVSHMGSGPPWMRWTRATDRWAAHRVWEASVRAGELQRRDGAHRRNREASGGDAKRASRRRLCRYVLSYMLYVHMRVGGGGGERR